MAQPTAYDRTASFSNIQAQAPDDPLPGNTLDAELNAIKQTLDELLANVALIQRDDGALANDSVGLDQLSEEIEVGWQAPEVWVTATDYVIGNTVFQGAGFYRCLVAHTAGTFSTDLAADKWELIVDLSDLTIVAASQIANTPAGSIAATTVQAAIDELASEKAALSHTHSSSAISDSTAAGRAFLTAADLAAQKTILELGDLAFLDTIPVTDIDAEIALSGILEPATLNSDTNDWAPTGIATASTIRMSASTSGIDITGILAPAADGAILVLENVGTAHPITLTPSSSASAAANRFLIAKPIVIGPNQSVVLTYDKDATTPRWRTFDRSSILPRGYLDGGTLSNAADTVNDITVQPFEARGARGILDLVRTSAITKRLDADWTAGSAVGGRYVVSAGSPAIANTTYHVHAIGKADGTTDVIFYTGADPTSILPTDYIDYHCLGSIVRDTTILQFTQTGDEFLLKVPVLDITETADHTTAQTGTLASCPTGFAVEAILALGVTRTGAAGDGLLVSALSQTNTAPSNSAAPGCSVVGIAGTSTYNWVGDFRVRTNTSAQIRYRATDAAVDSLIVTRGWIHPRGKNL